MLLRLVGSCWITFETGQTSAQTSANIYIVSGSSKRGPTMLGSFAQHIHQSCTGARALHASQPLSNLVGMNQRVVCMELWVFVSQSPLYSHLKTQHVVTCCEPLHKSASIAQQETTMLAQQCCVLMRAFARAFTLPSCSPNYPRASRIEWTPARHCPFLILKSFHDRDFYGNQLQQLPPMLFKYNTELTRL